MNSRHRDIVAVGASAGGVEALRALVAGLPADYPGVVLVVLHIPREAPSALPSILRRSGPLPASAAIDGEPARPGHVYVAPNDRHLLFLDGRLRLTRGPSENGHRPAIDPLFRSVARTAGERGVGVVLSGTRDDGAAGLAGIVARGGLAVVQEPDDALYPGMPRAALTRVRPHHILPAAKLGGLLNEIIAMDLPEDSAPTDDALLEAEVTIAGLGPLTTDELPVAPAGFGCPDCGGSLFEIGDEPTPRYRCRVGHAWSPESLLAEQAVALEGALWIALRALEEKSELSRRLAGSRDRPITSARFQELARETEAAGATIRQLIEQLGSVPDPEPAPDVR
ncbi:chemotaxis protein CheB [Actinoplanes sp. N902-109]|uniref:chemotaxis protein CheB n=1 Tax=Actinoplanes sp. (strain N902-109) TaxID=649831 RepID=UPI0003294A35|nr:chemotaxis protein CheB [Actinoplanes sp. N902-109]AGL18666.1 hypothetical protein L083_5156 [Actinoplanes sp. N902-109]